MEDATRDYIRSLLQRIKVLYGENSALKALLQTIPLQSLRDTWERAFHEILELPSTQKELDAKFDEHIEKIMRSLEDQEAIAALLRTPTKGLPN
jgi:hypothetical protein